MRKKNIPSYLKNAVLRWVLGSGGVFKALEGGKGVRMVIFDSHFFLLEKGCIYPDAISREVSGRWDASVI